MERIMVILLIMVIIFTGGVTDELHAETTREWTPEISKKLLESDLNNLLKRPQQESAVTYSLQFRELDSKLINVVESKISKSGSKDDSGTWQFITDKAAVEIIKEQAVNFSLEVMEEEKKEETQKVYNSYFTTIGNNPVKVKLEENMIGIEEDEADITKAHIEIIAKPHQINFEKDRVFTKLKLKYKGRSPQDNSGGIARIETADWIGQKAKKPVAIVTYRNDSSDRKHHKYFGLYVTAKVMPAESLSKNLDFISAGNVHGLDKLFNQKPQLFKKAHKLSLFVGGEGAELEFEKSFKNGSRFYTSVGSAGKSKQKDYQYKIGANVSVGKELDLALSGQVGNEITTEEDPILRVGASDQVTWNNNIDFKVSYFPFSYKWPEKEKTEQYAEAMLRYRQKKWSVKYEGAYHDDKRIDEVSVNYDYSREWGVEAKWKQKDLGQLEEKEKEASIGVSFKW